MSVAENIGFPLTLNSIVGRCRSKRINELLERIGLASAAKAIPHELSSGEAKRVAMARAIARNPKMLLADEPTANLDSVTGQRTVQLMHDIERDSGCTIIIATHDIEITKNEDSVIRLKDGRIHGEEQ
jgi:putative ABC transport system ATP-binding protein